MHWQPFSVVFFPDTQRESVVRMAELDMRCVKH